MNEIVLLERPNLPDNWSYDESVKRSKVLIYKWKGMTAEFARELWVAREKLSVPAQEAVNVSRNKSSTIKTWSGYCRDIGTQRQVANRWLKRWFAPEIDNEAKRAGSAARLREIQKVGKYNIIYADPPWQYYEGGFKNQSQHYITMTLEDICMLPVDELAAEDCVLFMWVTFPMLEHFMDVLRSWGFEYSTVAFTWVKANKSGDGFFFGLGNWTRSNAEICVMARRGSMERQDASISQIVYSPVEEHSKKPAVVRDKIVKLVGDLPRIELFAREKTEGWDVWGNEV